MIIIGSGIDSRPMDGGELLRACYPSIAVFLRLTRAEWDEVKSFWFALFPTQLIKVEKREAERRRFRRVECKGFAQPARHLVVISGILVFDSVGISLTPAEAGCIRFPVLVSVSSAGEFRLALGPGANG